MNYDEFIEGQKIKISRSLSVAIVEAINFMYRATGELDPSNPESVEQVNKFLTDGVQLLAFSEKLKRSTRATRPDPGDPGDEP